MCHVELDAKSYTLTRHELTEGHKKKELEWKMTKSRTIVVLDAERSACPRNGTARPQPDIRSFVSPKSLVESEETQDRRALLVTHFVSRGVSTWKLPVLISPEIHAALCITPPLESRHTLEKRLEQGMFIVERHVAEMLRGHAITITLDEASKLYGLAGHAIAVRAGQRRQAAPAMC